MKQTFVMTEIIVTLAARKSHMICIESILPCNRRTVPEEYGTCVSYNGLKFLAVTTLRDTVARLCSCHYIFFLFEYLLCPQ